MTESERSRGIGRVIVVIYAVLAIAATGRSLVQIVRDFDAAPVAYALSAVAAVVYILATVALVRPGRNWRIVAISAMVFELVGVLTVGILSLTMPALFAHPSVWSWFGLGYVFIPLVLPIGGLWWVIRGSKRGDHAT